MERFILISIMENAIKKGAPIIIKNLIEVVALTWCGLYVSILVLSILDFLIYEIFRISIFQIFIQF